MIGFLSGKVAGRTIDGCFIDVAGVGYRMTCSSTTLGALPPDGAACKLWTHVYVREDVLSLFGFATETEQHMFEALISVNGVGPKVALQVCSAYDPDSFRRALVTEDVSGLATVPGLGKKTAARIILDLKEKMALPDLQIVGEGRDPLIQARSALENLGYSPGEVRVALGEVQAAPDDGVEKLIKSALKVLAG